MDFNIKINGNKIEYIDIEEGKRFDKILGGYIEEPIDIGIVLYTDGSVGKSFIPNGPGVLGSGWHGYWYDINADKKTTTDIPRGGLPGLKSYLMDAFIAKYKKSELENMTVNPLGYIDGCYGDKTKLGYSNVSEIDAITYALRTIKLVKDNTISNIKRVAINSDSSYVLILLKSALDTLNNDPDILSNPDHYDLITKEYNSFKKESIDAIVEYIKEIKDIDIDHKLIEYFKVEGHSGEIGNEAVDILAKTAKDAALIRDIKDINFTTSYSLRDSNKIEEKTWKYWKDKSEWDPLINFKEIFYVNNAPDTRFTDPKGKNGEYITVMKYGKIEHGQKSRKPIFGIVFLPTVNETLRNVIDKYQSMITDEPILLYAVDLMSLGSANTINYFNLLGNEAFSLNKRNQLLINDKLGDPIAYPITPPGLATIAYNQILDLKEVMGTVLFEIIENNNPVDGYIVKDITDKIYDMDSKGKFKIKINNNDICIKVDMEIEGAKTTVPIEFKTDIIERNALKKLEDKDVKIYLACLKMTPGYYNYYTIIHNRLEGSYGIYCNLYSSKIILAKEKYTNKNIVVKKRKRNERY